MSAHIPKALHIGTDANIDQWMCMKCQDTWNGNENHECGEDEQ